MDTIHSSGTGASLQECLVGVGFPIRKAELLEHLREQGASPAQVAAIEASALERFESAQEVVAAVAGG